MAIISSIYIAIDSSNEDNLSVTDGTALCWILSMIGRYTVVTKGHMTTWNNCGICLRVGTHATR